MANGGVGCVAVAARTWLHMTAQTMLSRNVKMKWRSKLSRKAMNEILSVIFVIGVAGMALWQNECAISEPGDNEA